MSATVALGSLLDYSDHERAKWREWFAADPSRAGIVVQPGGRFPTAGALLEHVFYVERRHLCRLEGATPPEGSGVPAGDWPRLFEYGDLVRAELRAYVEALTDTAASETITFDAIGIGPMTISRRHLLMHIVLHEIRHLAQLALAARTAGIEPPGRHDLFFFGGFA